jgi:tetratricopeptide (TPR) repeat protein
LFFLQNFNPPQDTSTKAGEAMSFNKAKALKTASKYVQGGKYQSAIEEYRQIAQADPSDVTTLNTLGDLFVKVGQTTEAIASFMHIAEHYRVSGFYLKSIAMLKKVSKLDTGNVDVSLKLATLYAQQKLIVDARHQYLSVAEHYIREGQTKQALEIYQKIADLDPENTAVQIKLAEAFLRENQNDKAYDTFVLAAGEMRRQSKEGEALQTYLRAIKAQPRSQAALASAVNLYLERHETQQAIDLIEGLLAERPNDAELLTLLARIYQTTQNLEAAETAIDKMLVSARSRYQYALDLSQAYVQRRDVTGSLRVFDQVRETLYEYREEEKAAQLLREILTVDPQNVNALTRLSAVYERTHDDHLLVETLNLLVETALQNGSEPTAIDALKRLLELEPDEIQHRRRLRQLTGEEIETSSDTMGAGNYESSHSSNAGMDFWDQAESEDTTINQSPAEMELSNQVVQVQETTIAVEPEEAWGGWSTNSAQSSEVYANEVKIESSFGEAGTASGATTETFTVTHAGAAAGNLREELESVDFYLYQGMLDVARYTLESIATQFPNAPEVQEKLAQLRAAEMQTAQTVLTSDDQFKVVAEPVIEATTPAIPTEPQILIQPVVEETAAPVSLSLQDVETGYIVTPVTESVPVQKVDQASQFRDYNSSPNGQLAYAESVEGELVAPNEAVKTVHATQTTAQSSSTSFDLFEGDEMGELLDFLDEFKVETEHHKPQEDFETHYNLGQAYKEMDMFEEAIEEFQQAFKAVMNEPMHSDYVSCCSMLAFCFMQKGLPRLAVVWLKKGLEAPGRNEDVYHALRYDLADAYAALGDLKDAYNMFAEIYAVDVQYRGVKTRMQEIAAEMRK